jgi:hypothetical protein
MAGLRGDRRVGHLRVGRADMVDLRAGLRVDLRVALVDLRVDLVDRAGQADLVDLVDLRAGQADRAGRAGRVIGHHHFTGRRQYRRRIHNGGGGRCLTTPTTPTTHAKDSCSPATHNLPLRSNTRDKR